jgi:hypothetical protein
MQNLKNGHGFDIEKINKEVKDNSEQMATLYEKEFDNKINNL